jgi:hypothetical protein
MSPVGTMQAVEGIALQPICRHLKKDTGQAALRDKERLKAVNLFRDIFPAARCVLLICFLSTTNTPQLAAGIFYSA